MRLLAKQFFAIARLTALESIRQPICLILVTSSVLTIGVLPMIVAHSMGEEGKLIRDSVLSVYLLSGLFLSAYAACLAITHEIRKGTVSAVLTKPVNRKVAADPSTYELKTFTHIYQQGYGSPEVDQTTPTPTRATVSEDGLSVELEVADRVQGHVHDFHLPKLRSVDDEPLVHVGAKQFRHELAAFEEPDAVIDVVGQELRA